MGATLVTIAKDVKIQVEFNPAKVGAYRLIGYENRMLAQPGLQRRHQGRRRDRRGAPRHGPLRAGPARPGSREAGRARPAQVPEAGRAGRVEQGVAHRQAPLQEARRRHEPADRARRRGRGPRRLAGPRADFKFAAAVAGFGMLLRDSPHKGTLTYAGVAGAGRLEPRRRPLGLPQGVPRTRPQGQGFTVAVTDRDGR